MPKLIFKFSIYCIYKNAILCKMNNFFVNSASCWKRFKSTDNYNDQAEWYTVRLDNIDPDSFLKLQISKFKHEIYAYALDKSPYESDTKSIYLYISGFRYMKCSFDQANIMRVECRNDTIADIFRSCNEKLAQGRWPKLKKDFFNQFKQLQYSNAGYYAWGHFLFQKKNRV